MPVNQPTDPGLIQRGPSNETASRTRSFGWGYEPAPNVNTPVGPLNTGYVSSVNPDGWWTRGAIPIGGDLAFGLARPRYMREPGTNEGYYPSIKS